MYMLHNAQKTHPWLSALVLNCRCSFLLHKRSALSVQTTVQTTPGICREIYNNCSKNCVPTQLSWHSTCCIRVHVCTPGKEFLPKTMWHLDRQVRVRKRKRWTGMTLNVQSHAARQNQHQAENPEPQIKCLTYDILLSFPPSSKTYMQLCEEYF